MRVPPTSRESDSEQNQRIWRRARARPAIIVSPFIARHTSQKLYVNAAQSSDVRSVTNTDIFITSCTNNFISIVTLVSRQTTPQHTVLREWNLKSKCQSHQISLEFRPWLFPALCKGPGISRISVWVLQPVLIEITMIHGFIMDWCGYFVVFYRCYGRKTQFSCSLL